MSVALALLGTPLAAQVSSATLQAVAADEDGGLLPGVLVTVTNLATGATRQEPTGDRGSARFAALPPGTYRVEFTLEGFAPVVQESLVLRVGQTGEVKAVMKLQLSETITVSGTVPLVDVFKTDSSTNIVPEQIEVLPVPDRDFQRLAFIAPAVQRERGAFRFIAAVRSSAPAAMPARRRFSSTGGNCFRVARRWTSNCPRDQSEGLSGRASWGNLARTCLHHDEPRR